MRDAAAPRLAPASKPTQWSAAVFDVIEWRRFEALVEALFQQAGFETKSQSHGADQGVDIWLHSRNAPGQPVSVVQCKHWAGKRVGVDKIRELRGVMAAHGVSRGQFATTSTFTPDAITFARGNSINLLDVAGLLALIAKRVPAQQQALLSVALDGDYWKPTCVNCGTKMVERTPRNGGRSFWGCTNYPRCKTTMPMKAPIAA
jgi:restriction system protein